MLSHHWLDSLRRFVGIVEGNGANIVMQDVGLDDTVEKLSADETKFSIDCGGCTASVGPGLGGIVRKLRIGMLKICDRN